MTQINTAKIARGGFWTIASFGLVRALQLVSQVVLARLLSPEDFGIWAMVLLTTNLAQLFNEGSVAQVLIQRGLDDKKLVDTVYSLGINIAVVLFVINVLVSVPLSKYFGIPQLGPIAAFESLIFLLSAGASSHSVVLAREMKFKELAICSTATGIARFGGIVTCAALGGGVWSFAVGDVFSTGVNAVLTRSLSRYRFTYHWILDWSVVRKVYGFISSILGSNLATYANTNLDNLVIGKLLGAQALGYYNLAYQLVMLPLYAISQVNKVNFSVLSQRDNQGKQTYVSRVLELCALGSALIYGVGFVVAPWLIPTVYGREWVEAVGLFQIVLVFAYARGFMAILGVSLIALNKPGVNAAINWVLVPVAVASYVVGAWLGGTRGVATAVALVMGVGATVWFWIATCRVSGWNVKVLAKPVLLPTVVMSTTVAAVVAIPFPANLQPYLQPLTVVLVYGIAMIVITKGQVARMLVDVLKRSFNVGPAKNKAS